MAEVMSTVLGFLGLGPGELLLIALVGVLLFGNRLPEVGKSLGRGIVEFKKGIRGVDEEVEKASREKDAGGKES